MLIDILIRDWNNAGGAGPLMCLIDAMQCDVVVVVCIQSWEYRESDGERE